MASHFLKENMIRKKKFMKSRFPLIKVCVCIHTQYMSFNKEVRNKLAILHAIHNREQRITQLNNLFTYLYNTRDIWSSLDIVAVTVKRRLLHVSEEEPGRFGVYLVRIGYICPYPTINKEICSKQVDGTLCKTHSKSDNELKTHILENIGIFSSDLCKIILKYALPYSRN